MSLYSDILRGEPADDDDVRQENDSTWTVCCWEIDAEIPGCPSKEMALAIVRAIRTAYDRGADNVNNS